MTVDRQWAIEELETFKRLASPNYDGRGNYSPAGGAMETAAQAEVVEQIFDRCYPDWSSKRQVHTRYAWYGHIELAQRCIARLQREDEIRERLGESAPTLSASALHPWVWGGARSLWNSGHFREAVEAAAKSVNAYTQSKVNRRDVSEADLFAQAFSDDAPKADYPRLRPPDAADDSKSAKSLRRGIRDYASGCYAAIRNPKAHDDPSVELAEAVALEQLAAFSVLARWVDAADVARL